MAISLWPVLAACLALTANAAADCPYTRLMRDGSFPPKKAPLPPDQCAFLASLEDPLRRIVAVASIDAEGIVLDRQLSPGDRANAAYDDGKGIQLSDGFASCLIGDRGAAIAVLCHEVGHAYQWRGPDRGAREAVVALHAPFAPADFDDPAIAAANVDLERQADVIGRELCARAGFPLEFEAMPRAFMRCNGSPTLHGPSTHPGNPERLKTALEDKPRLSQQRAREIGAAIQRRARRLMAGASSSEDDSLDLSLSPREWALTPAADKDRLRAPYEPSATYESLRSRSGALSDFSTWTPVRRDQ